MMRLGMLVSVAALGAAMVWGGPALAHAGGAPYSGGSFENGVFEGRSADFDQPFRTRFSEPAFYRGGYDPCYDFGAYPYRTCEFYN